MALVSFSPSTIIKSSQLNSNFSGLADGTLIGAGVITPAHHGAEEAATEVTYLNSWVAYDSTQYYGWHYMKDGNGTVHLRGMGKNGTAFNAVMFTLPVGYRPPVRLLFNGTTSGSAFCRIDVLTDGSVQCIAGGSTSWISLGGISFKAGA